ncbi:MAG: EAL domain-containing protein, partial [Pseudomonadales bacterium]|nr:EAL domain-containing protein [Pseudomonadales bacterium]
VSCAPDKLLLLDSIRRAVSRAEQDNTRVAVLAVDIDALQRVNDTLGILSAQKFAKSIVARIKKDLACTDAVSQNIAADQVVQSELAFSVSHLSSNEIVVLLTDLRVTDLVTSFLYRIFAANKDVISVEGNDFYLNTNIGVSIYPSNGSDPDILLRNASHALQETKRKLDRNNFQFYSDEIAQRTRKLIQIEAELHHAVERGEFAVHYQPTIELSTGNIVGMEALLRWHHPQLGIVPPAEFIPIAEQSGLINEIDQWVLRTVCFQIHFWEFTGYDQITISVNLSPVGFRNPDFADKIITLVREMDVSPKSLEFEITRTVVMQSVDAAAIILNKLDQAGFTISLDGFGTGYSSLSYLKRFPIKKIKIDRSFIADALHNSDNAAIVGAIIAMSHSLSLRVVAEGVETQAQLLFLQDLRCDEVQGYLFGGVMSSENATNLLEEPSDIRHKALDNGAGDITLIMGENEHATAGMKGLLAKRDANNVSTDKNSHSSR